MNHDKTRQAGALTPPDRPLANQPKNATPEKIFRTELNELRDQHRIEFRRYLTARDRKVFVLGVDSGEIPPDLQPLFKSAYENCCALLLRHKEDVDSAANREPLEKNALAEKLNAIFMSEKEDLKKLLLREIAKHDRVNPESRRFWGNEGCVQILEHKTERWLNLKSLNTPLGQGAFGSVHLMKSADGNFFAGKEGLQNLSPSQYGTLQHELDAFKTVYRKAGAHRNLVNVYGAINAEVDGIKRPMLLMDAVSGLSCEKFFDHLRDCFQSRKISSAEYFGTLQFILSRLLDTAEHINKAGISHLDIKAENIIISNKDFEPRLIDMGLAAKHGSIDTGGTLGFSSMDHSRPEGISEKSDMYSIAATTVEAIESMFKGKVDPENGKWEWVPPNAGALKATYLKYVEDGDKVIDSSLLKDIDGLEYVEVKANSISTSYAKFVNKQLLSVDPHTGNIMQATPAERDRLAVAKKHPFLTHRMLEDESREKAVIEKVFKIAKQKSEEAADKQPQVPKLEVDTGIPFPADFLHFLIKKGDDPSLGVLASEHSWMKELEAFHRKPVESSIKADANSHGNQVISQELRQPKTKTKTAGASRRRLEEPHVLDRQHEMVSMARIALERQFPELTNESTIEDIKKYLEMADQFLEGSGNVSVAAPYTADLKTKIELVRARAALARNFLRDFNGTSDVERNSVQSVLNTIGNSLGKGITEKQEAAGKFEEQEGSKMEAVPIDVQAIPTKPTRMKHMLSFVKAAIRLGNTTKKQTSDM